MDEKTITGAEEVTETPAEALNEEAVAENAVVDETSPAATESTESDESSDETESCETDETKENAKRRFPVLSVILAAVLLIISVGVVLAVALPQKFGFGDPSNNTPVPTLVPRDIIVPRGGSLEPTDFLSEPIDISEGTVEFVMSPDTSADGSVTLRLTDRKGNISEASAAYTVSDTIKDREFEFGITREFIESRLIVEYGLDLVELSSVDTSACGTYRVSGELDGVICVFAVKISDTTAPFAFVYSLDLLLGQTVDINDIVTDISDTSEVSMTYTPEIDLGKPGKQEISITLTDESGNFTEYTAFVNIYTLPSSIVIEAGTPYEEFSSNISMMLGIDNEFPRFPDDFDTLNLEVGTYEVELTGEYSEIPLEIIVEDTVAPEFTVRPISVYTGTELTASVFVTGYTDFSEVDFKFAYEPNFEAEGNYIVTIIGTDKAGNTAEKSTTLKISRDNAPPTIYGIKNITAYEGDTVSYRSGVYAMDEKDGKVTVKANASLVNTSKPGTYTVTYTAADAEGNTATATATVTINAITASAVNEKADEVLAVIVNDSMSDRQKARAIYDWCTVNIKYSTSTSHLMGYFDKAAYSGFTRHYGNCYTYYAVASALLTRAGITNVEIQRNNPKNPHYWNLVSIDGNWYHFDTCPQPAPHKLAVFLLTDAELKAFPLDYYYSFSAGVYPATP